MSDIILTTEDRRILIEANNLYLFDWRENDDDEATAGWRHPGYFLEVGKPNDFKKLVDAGLMEKGGNPDYATYRISELGMEEVAKLEALAPAEAQAARIRELEAALMFAKSELSKIPAPITQTRFATETINSVWSTIVETLEALAAKQPTATRGDGEA